MNYQDVIRVLKEAERYPPGSIIQPTKDNPEGTVVIALSDTLVTEMTKALERVDYYIREYGGYHGEE